jgi:methylated-DNA-[protein]-cysteine S-methyltransferase
VAAGNDNDNDNIDEGAGDRRPHHRQQGADMTDAVLATTVTGPLGELALLVHDDVLVSSGFGAAEEMHARLRGAVPMRRVNDLGPFSAALTAYFDGELTAMDTLPVFQPGGAFRQAAWKLMREVPPGETISYAELAVRAGSPGAARAAGSACAQNLIAPVVPCHRIVPAHRGALGLLGGYAYGLERKEWLLAHEQARRG